MGIHSHTTYEYHYIPKGKGHAIIEGKKYDLYPGVFYLTGPGVNHEQYSDPEVPMGEFCLDLDIAILKKYSKEKDTLVKNEINSLVHTLFLNPFWYGDDALHTMQLFEKVIEELDQKMTGYFIAVRNYLMNIVIDSVRCLTKLKKAEYCIPLKTPDEKREDLIFNMLYGEYCKNLTLEAAAKRVGVSTRHFNRLLLKLFSKTFKEKLIEIRLEKAKELLRDSRLSIDRIAVCIGFTNSSYFSRSFKETMGLSPTEYRARCHLP